ncbi:MAG: type II toxin-antitoxin system RelE/ParE family toxin [Bacillota bacterium]
MGWNFTPDAEADLARLDAPVAQRVLKRLRWLAEKFEVIRPELLTGQWQSIFKLRVGDYRVLYTCDRAKRKIIVHFIRHRREVYKIT